MKIATMSIREISSVEDFNDWANRANEAWKKESLSDLQDIFARSETKLLKSLFNTEDGSRKLWLFGILKCMGEEVVLDFIKSFARSLVDRDAMAEEKRLNEELGKKIFDCEWRKAELDKKESQYQLEIKHLNYQLQTANREIQELNSQCNELEDTRNAFKRDSVLLGELRIVLQQIHDRQLT